MANMLTGINRAAIYVDKITDYVPIVSTVTNLIDLFIKYAWKLSVRNPDSLFLEHLKVKEFERCCIGLLPGIGNLYLLFCDIIFRLLESKISR